MEILKVKFKNFKSYGNKEVLLDFENDFKGDLVLLQGLNGGGKCCSPNTQLDIDFKGNPQLEKLFLSYLDKK